MNAIGANLSKNLSVLRVIERERQDRRYSTERRHSGPRNKPRPIAVRNGAISTASPDRVVERLKPSPSPR